MKKTEILIISENSNNSDTSTIYNNESWNHSNASADEQAIEKLSRQNFDVALIDTLMAEESRKKLNAVMSVLNPELIILTFNSENAKDMSTEIKAALKERSQKNRSVTVSDDAFKGYRLN